MHDNRPLDSHQVDQMDEADLPGAPPGKLQRGGWRVVQTLQLDVQELQDCAPQRPLPRVETGRQFNSALF